MILRDVGDGNRKEFGLNNSSTADPSSEETVRGRIENVSSRSQLSYEGFRHLSDCFREPVEVFVTIKRQENVHKQDDGHENKVADTLSSLIHLERNIRA